MRFMTDTGPLVSTYCIVIQNVFLDTLFSSGISPNIIRTFEKKDYVKVERVARTEKMRHAYRISAKTCSEADRLL